MVDTVFDGKIERVRQQAAAELPASCRENFQRLSRTLVYGPAFQWVLVDAPDEALRRQVMAALDDVLRAAGLTTNRLPLSAKIADVPELEARLVKNAGAAAVVHVIGRPGWFDAARWDTFNARRERLATSARARLVFWLDAAAIALASRIAPDLWAWRAGVYAFLPEAVHVHGGEDLAAQLMVQARLMPLTFQSGEYDNRTLAQRQRRIVEIRDWLVKVPPPSDELSVGPLCELGRLLFSLGDHDAALAHWRDVELPLHRRLKDIRAEALTNGQVADVLQVRGQLDEALRLRKEELLPVYERLGDEREKAVTMGKIADILQARGQLDEALRIRQEEQLPVYERLGDLREKAVTMGGIADILEARGQLDEALRIRQGDQLPTYERLGDMRSMAVTMGKIADILEARGQLDEAMRIHKEEQLPIYERLGDVRLKAVAMGGIADILLARGQFDEALRIHKEEQLPVFERLGDVREKAVTLGKIADILEARGQLDEALALHEQRLQRLRDAGYLDDAAHALYSIARVRMLRGDLQRDGLSSVRDTLSEAFSISLKSKRADALIGIGTLLERVLRMAGQTEQALEVMRHVETAFKQFDDARGIAQMQQFRQQIDPVSPSP